MASDFTDTDLPALQNDIAALRADVATLMDHLKLRATEPAEGAIHQIDESLHRLYRTATAEGERSARAVSQQIEENPVMALLLAAGLGYISGRLLSR